MKRAMFERDLLYPTNNQFEPGSVHVTVYQPGQAGGIPVMIEAKTAHNPLDYLNDIVAILQADVFDRIRIDIRKSGILNLKLNDGNYKYYRIKFKPEGGFETQYIKDFDIQEE